MEHKNREEYLKSLIEKNGYCSCEEMQELYNTRRNVEQMLEKNSSNTTKAIRKYDAKLTYFANKGKLEVRLHDITTRNTKQILCSDIKKEDTVTVHCPECKNQIDLICQ